MENDRLDYPPSSARLTEFVALLALDPDDLHHTAGVPADLAQRPRTDRAFLATVRRFATEPPSPCVLREHASPLVAASPYGAARQDET